MFNYPAQSKDVCVPGNYPLSVEQLCPCGRWFVVSQEAVKAAMDVWSAPPKDGFGFPFQYCSCTHCGRKEILVMVGKYDPPFARSRARCAVQFWRWEKSLISIKETK